MMHFDRALPPFVALAGAGFGVTRWLELLAAIDATAAFGNDDELAATRTAVGSDALVIVCGRDATT